MMSRDCKESAPSSLAESLLIASPILSTSEVVHLASLPNVEDNLLYWSESLDYLLYLFIPNSSTPSDFVARAHQAEGCQSVGYGLNALMLVVSAANKRQP